MKYPIAKKYADQIVEWLRPFCERIEIAGSVRRGKAECNDVDVVVIPRVAQARDLFGTETSRRNLLAEELRNYVTENQARGASWLRSRDGVTTASSTNFYLQLPKCELNVFCAEEANFGAVWLTYTGSREANLWMIERAKTVGLVWSAKKGVGKELPDGMGWVGKTEQEIYRALKMPYVEPPDREIGKLARVMKFE